MASELSGNQPKAVQLRLDPDYYEAILAVAKAERRSVPGQIMAMLEGKAKAIAPVAAVGGGRPAKRKERVIVPRPPLTQGEGQEEVERLIAESAGVQGTEDF